MINGTCCSNFWSHSHFVLSPWKGFLERTHWKGTAVSKIWLQVVKFVCSTGLPLAITRWVLTTFSSHCPLSCKQSGWLPSETSIIFGNILGTVRIKPGAAGSWSKHANHYAMLPPPRLSKLWIWFDGNQCTRSLIKRQPSRADFIRLLGDLEKG